MSFWVRHRIENIDTFDKEESNNSSFDERVDHESSVKNHFVNEDSLKTKSFLTYIAEPVRSHR